ATSRSAARRARVQPSPTSRRARAAGGGSRTRRRSAGSTARSRAAVSSTSCTPCWATKRMPKVSGDAQHVARAEAQAVLAMVQDERKRAKLADVVAAVDEGVVEGADADALADLLALGLSRGRVRALYGPAGKQAAFVLFRLLPLGKEIAETTREL